MRKNIIMKRIITILLVMTLVMSFAACGDEKKENETDKNSANKEESGTEESAKKVENIHDWIEAEEKKGNTDIIKDRDNIKDTVDRADASKSAYIVTYESGEYTQYKYCLMDEDTYEISISEYDKHGELVKGIKYVYEYGVLTTTSEYDNERIEYENMVNYDCFYKMSDEKCKSMLWYFYEDGKETSHSISLYNEDGMMYAYCDVTGSITHGWEPVELDEKGNAKSVRKYEYKDDEVVYDYISEEHEYEYNDKGLIVKEIIKKEIYGEDAEILEYAYDENDNVTKYTWTKGNSVYVTNYEYDDNNNCIKETAIDEYGGESTIIHKYDSNGNLLENAKVRYEYDENGRLAKKTDWTGYTYVNKYDSYGNLVKEIVYAPNSTDVEYIIKHEYMGTENDFTVTVKDSSSDRYMVYTYKEAKLVTEETYDNDELSQKIKYEY